MYTASAQNEFYTLSLHDALPILLHEAADISDGSGTRQQSATCHRHCECSEAVQRINKPLRDRKSTRLNSSHSQISYAVSGLKKKHELRGASPSRSRCSAWRQRSG